MSNALRQIGPEPWLVASRASVDRDRGLAHCSCDASGCAEDPFLVDIEQEAKRIHDKVLVLDSHVDIPVDYGTGRTDPGIDGETQVDLPKLEQGGVGAAVFAVFAKQGRRTPEGLSKARRKPIASSRRSLIFRNAIPNAPRWHVRPTTSNGFTAKRSSPSSSAS